MTLFQYHNTICAWGTFGTLLVALLLTGCAGTAPRATFTEPPSPQQRIDSNDSVSVKVDAPLDVVIADNEKQRLASKIHGAINSQKMNNTEAGDQEEYELAVQLSRYDKGNTAMRFLLAGLGQIHIDAHISVSRLPERVTVSEFDLEKTFAWGGIYGATTSIADVENGFAQGVAEAVTGTE